MRHSRVLIASALFVLACHEVAPEPPAEPVAPEDTSEADVVTPTPVVVEADPAEPAKAPGPTLPDGAMCNVDSDCGADELCEGLGCESGQGRCVARERMCTRDLTEYCGCDGQEFKASGTCPGARYAYRGACEPQLEDGESCADGRQCKSGQCVGEGLEGCGRGAAGVCGASECTRDLAAYCGCNNTEFQASGTCPNRQFAYRGPCEEVDG